MQRLQKAIAAAGIASRRKSEELIRAGRVAVDGEVVTTPGHLVDPSHSEIRVDNQPLPKREPTYLLLNKPTGVLSTRQDTHGRRTVLDLVGEAGKGLYPAGRLDADTEGLLLLTDDGELTLRLTHPRYEVPKVYLVQVQGKLDRKSAQKLTQGIELEDGLARVDQVRLIEQKPNHSRLELELHTGKKRQIRRMLTAIGHPVIALTRTRMGPLTLGHLPKGHWRKLNPAEVARLRKSMGLETRPQGH